MNIIQRNGEKINNKEGIVENAANAVSNDNKLRESIEVNQVHLYIKF